jgi:hypothetical protein
MEASDVGRTVISAFIVLILVAVLSENLPSSSLQRGLAEVSRPLVRALNIRQVWGVFAPDPRRQTVDLSARILFDDGRVETWRPPDGLPFPNSYRDVRWRRWAESISRPDLQAAISLPTAQWLARRYTTEHRRPARVELILRTQNLLPPGEEPDRAAPQETVVYSLDVASNVLSENEQ